MSVLDFLAMLTSWGAAAGGGPCDVDFDGTVGRGAVDVRDLAGLAEDRKLRFQVVDQVERFQGGLGAPFVLTGVEPHFELTGHCLARDADHVGIVVAE